MSVDIRKAKESLHERLKDDPDFSGIGITKVPLERDGVDAIYVMLRDGDSGIDVPTVWEGHPVVVNIVGVIRPERR